LIISICLIREFHIKIRTFDNIFSARFVKFISRWKLIVWKFTMSNWKSLTVTQKTASISLNVVFNSNDFWFQIELKDILTKENSDLLNQIDQQKSKL